MKHLQNPIIFIGTGRSGTTIVSEIISRHPHLAYPSNYNDKFPNSKNINLLRLLFDNPLWKIYGQKKQLNKTPFLNKYFFNPHEAYEMWDHITGKDIDFSKSFLLEDSLTEDRIHIIRDYFNAMVKLQNKKRLIFKITGPSRITFLSKIFPDAVFINLKRNRIPTISSFLKVKFWQTRGINKLWWTGAYDDNEQKWAKENASNGPLLTAFQLNKIDETTNSERHKIQPKYLEVHYEDFVANPEKILETIIEFTNLSPFNYKKYLKKVKIFNRNKKDSEYFSDEDLTMIYQIIENN